MRTRDKAKVKKQGQRIIVLHDVRSIHNVGSVFRTADCAGVQKIYLTGITPSPLLKTGVYDPAMEKVALGAQTWIPWEKKVRAASLIAKLKKEGWRVAAAEQSTGSRDHRQFARLHAKENICVVLGNEVKGLPKNILTACDDIIEIPMKGKKESLNVSVAAGIVLFALMP